MENTLLHMSNEIKQDNSDSCIIEIHYKSLFLYCFTSFHWTLVKNNNRFGLVISKLRENTLLNMSNTTLEVCLKFWTSWQWQLHHGTYKRIIPYIFCLISFHWTLIENNDGDGLSIPKLRESTLFHMSNTFLEVFWNYKQVGSDNCIIENRLEITVFKMFNKLHWTFIENNDVLGLSISKLRKNSYCTCQTHS